MPEQSQTTSPWTSEEIAQILKAAELFRQKGATQKFNVAAFCDEVGISRKNAYKHKKKYENTLSGLQLQLEALLKQHDCDAEKIRLLQERVEQVDMNEKLRLVMRELIVDYQKKDSGRMPRRQRLIDKYNRLSKSLGQEPLNL